MEGWLSILDKALRHGVMRSDRTGIGTLALFGEQLCFDNSWRPDSGINVFPAVTTKKLFFRQVAAELACFLRGYDNLEQFNSMGCSIWDANGRSDYWLPRARHDGDLGRIYGVQWRAWRSAHYGGLLHAQTDQLKSLVDGVRRDPYGRRHLVTAWNPGELEQMCLPPCHVLFQAFVHEELRDGGACRVLSLRVDMRSVDLFIGLPFDVASYALLQRLLASELGMCSGKLVFQLGDAHVYLNHQDQVRTVLARQPLAAPQLSLSPAVGLFDFHPDQAWLSDYNHHGAVSAPMNV